MNKHNKLIKLIDKFLDTSLKLRETENGKVKSALESQWEVDYLAILTQLKNYEIKEFTTTKENKVNV